MISPYYQDEWVTIYLGDCREILPTLEKVDLVLTSPPYNKTGLRGGKLGHSHDWHADMAYIDNLDERVYWEWQVGVLDMCYRVLKDTGSVLYNHKVRRYEGVAYHPLIEVIRTKLSFYQQIVWDRGNAVDNNLKYLQPTTELILWFVKHTPKVFKDNIKFKGEVWHIPMETNTNHPAPFPKALADNCINLCSELNDIILDPFLGSGTTAYCAKKLNRKCIGIEIEEKYCEIAAKRCSQSVMRLDI